MALYDDKRFILSHIRHSFITCDDTGMCETVMLNEHHNRYPTESMYHHPFDYDSEEDLDYFGPCGEVEDEDELAKNGGGGESLSKGRISQDDIDFFKVTEVDYKSELVEDNPMNSFDIMSDSYEMGMRRRSNTAQRLEKLKKERKFQSKTKVITWKSPTKIVTVLDGPDSVPQEKRVVLNPTALGPEELALLEFDENEGVYYETVAYRKLLFPYLGDDDDDLETPTNEPQDDVLSPLSDLPDLPVTRSKPKDRRKSILTLQIERCPTAPVNPFNEFTRFDGLVSEGNAHTKRIRIFFRIFESNPEFQKTDFTRKLGLASSGIACGANWIEIVVLASARVSDLIGLICWNYTHLQLGPPLKPDPSMYALKIAEENGDVDNDFPALTASDDIKRYGFPYLALVELETNIVVTVNFDPDAVFSQITINSLATTLKEIIEQVKKKRPHLFKVIQGPLEAALRLELRSKPGIPLDLSSKISEYVDARAATKGGSGASHLAVNFSLKFTKTDENRKTSLGGLLDVPEGHEEIGSGSFKGSLKPPATAPIRANRSSIALFSLDASDTSNALATTSATASQLSRSFHRTRDWSQNMLDMMEAPLYQCFEVNAVHKLYNTPVELGISGSNVEIAPRTGSGAGGRSPNFADRLKARFNQMKAINIEVEDVVDCELIRRGKMELLGRHIFKLVYYNGNSHFKSLKFEADAVTVDDILFKLSNVMRMRTSPRRTEYQAIKSRKKSISTKIYLKSKMMLSSSSSSSDEDTTTGDDSTGPLSTGADSSVLSDPDGGGSSWISTLGRQKKADSSTSQNNKFRRFKSRP